MIQLTRQNCAGDRLQRLLGWLRELDALGISSARLHVLEIETPGVRNRLAMSIEENVAALDVQLDDNDLAELDPLSEQVVGARY